MRDVIGELERLGRRSRALLILQRASVLLAWMLIVILAAIGIDFGLRLPAEVRLIMLALGAGALALRLWVDLRPALSFRPSLTQLALRVERLMPSLTGRLASSVEFASAGLDQGNALAARSVKDAQSRLAGESVLGALRPGRTLRDAGLLLGAAAIAATLAVAYPAGAATGLSRLLLPYGAAEWPARTGVESLMHETSRAAGVHPREAALALRARVTKGALDQRVDAHYRLTVDGEDEPWRAIVLTHQAGGVHERLVDTDAEAIELYFETDDARTNAETIALVPPPAVERATLSVTPPDYARDLVQPLSAELGQGVDRRSAAPVPSLGGSMIDLAMKLNKPLPVPEEGPLREAWLERTLGWAQPVPPRFAVDAVDPSRWLISWTLEDTAALDLELTDEHGLTNPEPLTYRIDAIEDRPPSVTITRPQGDEIVLPTAAVELAAEARDDVAIESIGMEATRQRVGDPEPSPAVEWSASADGGAAVASINGQIDLAALGAREGEVFHITGLALDIYEREGERHALERSAPRRLRVISEMEFATQLRRELSALRQQAIRVEAMQAELQDDVTESGVQPGVSRAQAQIAERLADQAELIDAVQQRMRANRLQDEQLGGLLEQSQDLLDFAGRAANQATDAIRAREGAPRRAEQRGDDASDAPEQNETDDRADASPAPELHEPAPEDQPIVESQQLVRDELADLIELLDRDEDTWVVTRQLDSLAEAQQALQAQTQRLNELTMGRERSELQPEELTELDRITQRQRDLAEQARQLIEDMRRRAEDLESVDPQSAQGLRTAANTGEQDELSRDMENAAQQAQQNRLQGAASSQQSASQTLNRMRDNVQDTRRARAEELQRRLMSLVESIARLITIQENELASLGVAEAESDFSGRDRGMIRLAQNTQAVAAEARAAGQESRRIARSLDRATDAQGAAVSALRGEPINAPAAREAEEHSLALLKEAKQLSEALLQQSQEAAVEREREALMERYREFARKQVEINEATRGVGEGEALDRRQLVEARGLANQQEQVRAGLEDLRAATEELTRAPVFSLAHRQIDRWSKSITASLREGQVNAEVTERQQLVADSLGRLIEALETSFAPPPEFADASGRPSDQGGGGDGAPPGTPALIPRGAELRLLRGLQEQVYDQTRAADAHTSASEAQQRERLREIAAQQRDLLDLGRQMLESVQQPGREPTDPQEPLAPDDGSGEPAPPPPIPPDEPPLR
jgi:hypothetical protein